MNQVTPIKAGWTREGRQPRIAIIGAGMSGIAAVVKLRRAGYTDLTVFEKAATAGGTWRENSYPGLSCDVPSHWYSFTFAPNPDWSYRFSYGPEIRAYMEKTAQDFGVTDITRFNTRVTELTYEAPQWRVKSESKDGTASDEIYDVVIAATGILHQPVYPDIEGLDSFEGAKFHSARWDHSVSLEGKRVGVIGTGSTASQIVGAIAAEVGHLDVYQRTPQWMVPLPQKKYSAVWKWLLRHVPGLTTLLYNYYYWGLEHTFNKATLGDKKQQKKISDTCLKNLNDNVKDPELRKKLTPDYQAACKRMIFCSDFYPAVSRPNVDVVTEGIERIEPKGVRTKDGELHELDVLVLATGFNPGAFILPAKVYGEDKMELGAMWDGAPRAHRAVAVPHFPNFWMLEGPTGPVGNLSLITISELQVDYIISCLDKMKEEHLLAMAPKQQAFETYNKAMGEAIKSTIWVTGGCNSWYIDKTGTPNLYPWSPAQFREDMRNPHFEEFRLIDEIPGQNSAVAAAE